MTDTQPAESHSAESNPAESHPAEQLHSQLEALLLIADEPVSETTLAAGLDVPVADVQQALAALVDFYDHTGRGFELRSVASGWRYYTRAAHADLVGRHLLEGQHAKLSRPALETLAVVAYLQPVARSRVSAVRGVNVDGVIRTLLARELITETGAEDSGATLFATTDYFLERMGLDSLDELPDLAPYLPDAGELEIELGQLAVGGHAGTGDADAGDAGAEAADSGHADPAPADAGSANAGDADVGNADAGDADEKGSDDTGV